VVGSRNLDDNLWLKNKKSIIDVPLKMMETNSLERLKGSERVIR